MLLTKLKKEKNLKEQINNLPNYSSQLLELKLYVIFMLFKIVILSRIGI